MDSSPGAVDRFVGILDKMLDAFEVGFLERRAATMILDRMRGGLDDDTFLRGLRAFELEFLPYIYYGDRALGENGDKPGAD